MSTKPTIVLVHGFWGGAAHWSKVIVELSRKGYDKLRAVELPLTSLADDAERTRKMVAQQQGPVLLVGHSYGGAVITEAGDLPNVVGLVNHYPTTTTPRLDAAGPGMVFEIPESRAVTLDLAVGGGSRAAQVARARAAGSRWESGTSPSL